MAVYLTKSMLRKLSTVNPKTLTSENIPKVKGNLNNLVHESPMRNEIVDLAKNLICRVCAKEGCTPLMEELDEEYDIMSAIRSITNISISVDDSLPQFICSQCLDLLKLAHSFKKTCLRSDVTFKSMLVESGVSSNQSYKLKHDFNLILHKMKCNRMLSDEERSRNQRNTKKDKKKLKKAKNLQMHCLKCKAEFTSKESLSVHKKEGGCRRRACDLCGQLVLSLTQHKRISHREPTNQEELTCNTCGKTYTALFKLKSHMRIHSDTFLFQCDLCPYRSKYKYYLVMHMRTHTGEKPYKCPQADCAAAFVNHSNLNKHKLVHQEKQIKCSQCDKSFRTKKSLRGHIEATHMRIKHKCSNCERFFSYKSDLRKHEIRVHNRKKRDYIGGEPAYKQAERAMQADSLQHEQHWQVVDNKVNGEAIQWTADGVNLEVQPPPQHHEQQQPTATEWPDSHLMKIGQKQAVVEWGPTQVVTVTQQEQPTMPCILREVFYMTDLNGALIQPTQIVEQHTMQVLPGMSSAKKEDKMYEPQPGISFY